MRADAIGGVVNIILLKETCEGFNANAEVGDSHHGGGFEKHFERSSSSRRRSDRPDAG
jgi:outer membrane cobalamin receptor